MLINLISNAIKYNDAEHPEIGVSSRIAGTDYIIEVSDNGPGIAEKDRARIFHKFYRGGRSARPREAGAGLGLPISREIIASMNGTLDLVDHKGQGACFAITLPLLEPDPAKAPSDP
ncbi:ATP-binding protein [Devosia algicola]|uniref:histidine kinase n=1 Tax=Devosia algicola TaxID=3026418 RepID=A0ABY7YLA0_9HYPH|nr:ATP-binding protein [Devosia algicola]WDR02066.1 ATP-binding protein [Devosia algicola]